MPCKIREGESVRQFHLRRWRNCKCEKAKAKMREALIVAGWLTDEDNEVPIDLDISGVDISGADISGN